MLNGKPRLTLQPSIRYYTCNVIFTRIALPATRQGLAIQRVIKLVRWGQPGIP